MTREAIHHDRHRPDPADPAAPVAVRAGRPGDARRAGRAHLGPQVRDHGRALVPGPLPVAAHHAGGAHRRGPRADRRHPRLRERAVRRFELAHVLPRHRQGEVPPPRDPGRPPRPRGHHRPPPHQRVEVPRRGLGRRAPSARAPSSSRASSTAPGEHARWPTSTRPRSWTGAPSSPRTWSSAPTPSSRPGSSSAQGCVLHAHAVVRGTTLLGARNVVHPFAVVGGEPQAKRHTGRAGAARDGRGQRLPRARHGARRNRGARDAHRLEATSSWSARTSRTTARRLELRLRQRRPARRPRGDRGLGHVRGPERRRRSASASARAASSPRRRRASATFRRSSSSRATARACAASTSWACGDAACRKRASARSRRAVRKLWLSRGSRAEALGELAGEEDPYVRKLIAAVSA